MKNVWIIGAVAVVLIGGFFVLSKGDGNVAVNDGVGTSVGDAAPEFSFTTIEGAAVDSTDLNGQVVVVTSSAAWCNTCVAEALQFASVYPSVKHKDVYFLTVDIDPSVTDEQIRDFQAQTVSPWAYVSARGGTDIIQNLKLKRFEITYIIDGNGVIVFKDGIITDANTLENELNKII